MNSRFFAAAQNDRFTNQAPLSTLARRCLNKELHDHGMGRHSREEIHAIDKRDITTRGDFLAHKPYFMGDLPCSLNAAAYAFIANRPGADGMSDPATCAAIRSTEWLLRANEEPIYG